MLLSLALAFLQEDSSGLRAEYQFALLDPQRAVVDATLRLSGLTGPIDLVLPESFAFVSLPEPRLEGTVSASGAGGTIAVTRAAPFRWSLDPGGAAEVELKWSVPLDHRALPEVAQRDDYEFPYLEADHGLLVMGALALTPAQPAPGEIQVRFLAPAGWSVYAPWPELASGAYAPPSSRALADDLVAIGAWDVDRRRIGGLVLTCAFAPRQERLQALAGSRLAPIVARELELFGCTPQPSYLFVFGRSSLRGFGGSPKTNSMTLFVSEDLPEQFIASGVAHLVAHEFHHTWMRAKCSPADELRFVVEGFTDWYSYLVPLQLSLLSPEEFRATFLRKLAEHEENAAHGRWSLAAAGGPEFFAGKEAYRATYAGGLALAALCDLAIRRTDPQRSLDDLLRAFYNDPRWDGAVQPTLADFLALLESCAGREFRDSCAALIQTPGPVDWVVAFAAQGLELQRGVENGAPRYALAAGTERLPW